MRVRELKYKARTEATARQKSRPMRVRELKSCLTVGVQEKKLSRPMRVRELKLKILYTNFLI